MHEREPQEPEEGPELNRAVALRRVRHLAAGQGGVGFVDRHRDPPFAAQPLREADVVGVPVGEDQCPDVGGRAAHHGQLPGDVGVEAGHPGVDDRYLAGLLDEVCVDHAVVANPVDAWRNLHDGILHPAG
jgi:hypothetical protein